jgi:hypothetical protein
LHFSGVLVLVILAGEVFFVDLLFAIDLLCGRSFFSIDRLRDTGMFFGGARGSASVQF